jgi:hypothetical protein
MGSLDLYFIESIHDALEGVGRPPVAMFIGGKEKKEDAEFEAKTAAFMEEPVVQQSSASM